MENVPQSDPSLKSLSVTGQAVYVVTQDAASMSRDKDIGLIDLWHVLWDGKWWIAAITGLFIITSVIYALTATEWYSADVLLVPADERAVQGLGALSGQLGGLASLAGVTVGGGNSVEPLAVLNSRGLAQEFIEDGDLLTVLFADDWNSESNTWDIENPEDWPDIRDAVERFDKHVLTRSFGV
jgi:hypothetical protein